MRMAPFCGRFLIDACVAYRECPAWRGLGSELGPSGAVINSRRSSYGPVNLFRCGWRHGGPLGWQLHLQLDHPARRVADLADGQAELVPEPPEPLTASPGDRLLQLPPAYEVGRAGGGARCGCPTRCGQAACALMIWWG